LLTFLADAVAEQNGLFVDNIDIVVI